jgi:fluoride exporter
MPDAGWSPGGVTASSPRWWQGRVRGRRAGRSRLGVLGAVSAGGVVGALIRDRVEVAVPHSPGGFPWATFDVNVCGCLLIGVLMVYAAEVRPHRLVRPFLGVGVLGGFTTFSTQAVDARQAVTAGAAGLAMVYLAGTLVVALTAAWAGSALTLALVRASHRRQVGRER